MLRPDPRKADALREQGVGRSSNRNDYSLNPTTGGAGFRHYEVLKAPLVVAGLLPTDYEQNIRRAARRAGV